jgi:hypothetical protein
MMTTKGRILLQDPSTKIKEGGRHDAVKILGCSYFYRYKDGWKHQTDDQGRDKLKGWNQQHCIPPLPDDELVEIWNWIMKTHRTTRDKEFEQLRDTEKNVAAQWETQRQTEDPFDMPGCISYKINSLPDKYIQSS